MFKKVLHYIAVAIVSISLAACGNTPSENKKFENKKIENNQTPQISEIEMKRIEEEKARFAEKWKRIKEQESIERKRADVQEKLDRKFAEEKAVLERKRAEEIISKAKKEKETKESRRIVWNDITKITWNNRNSATLKLGQKVCTYNNHMGFADRIEDGNVRVLVKGKLETSYSKGYFFGNQTKYEFDRAFHYQPQDSVTWFSQNEIADCDFTL
jgi:hypothetical protein